MPKVTLRYYVKCAMNNDRKNRVSQSGNIVDSCLLTYLIYFVNGKVGKKSEGFLDLVKKSSICSI